MKSVLRYFLINLVALYLTTRVIQGLTYTGGVKSLLVGAVAFAVINFLLVPLLKVLFLPLNLLTLGLFAWLTNVLAIYALTTVVTDFKLLPFTFPGFNLGFLIIPSMDLTVFWVAVVSSLMIGFITHFLHWLSH